MFSPPVLLHPFPHPFPQPYMFLLTWCISPFNFIIWCCLFPFSLRLHFLDQVLFVDLVMCIAQPSSVSQTGTGNLLSYTINKARAAALVSPTY